MTAEQWEARAEAYLEAAIHLTQNWTDDNEEWEQAKIVKKILKRARRLCLLKASIRKLENVICP